LSLLTDERHASFVRVTFEPVSDDIGEFVVVNAPGSHCLHVVCLKKELRTI
jgi:hypothetical protein